MRRFRQFARDWLPPALIAGLRRHSGRTIRFEGDYPSWEAALSVASGYGADEIIERSLEAARKVRLGEAAFERDAVTFDRVEYSLPFMAGLLRVAAQSGGQVRVLDFGGGFGSGYLQLKSFVPNAVDVKWGIVEQDQIAEAGKTEFETDDLRFFASFDACLDAVKPNVAVFSSSLQYLPEPYAIIDRTGEAGIPHVIVDRTPVSGLERDILSVQFVPEHIYSASYPCRVFSRQRFLHAFSKRYTMLAEFCDSSGEWRSGSNAFLLGGFLFDSRSE